MFKRFLLLTLLTGLAGATLAAEGPHTPANLRERLDQIAAPSGIRFDIAPDLVNDPAPPVSGKSAWPEVVRELLHGYNHAGTWDGKGNLVAVRVTGRNGNGTLTKQAVPATDGLLVYRRPTPPLPTKYRSHHPGSVHAVVIPKDRLRRMKPGERIAVDLPDGRYQVVHDKVWRHPNGDLTWVGHLDGTSGLHRTLLTLGDEGTAGRIQTPNGLYEVESETAGDWLVDIPASGLQPGALAEDGLPPPVGLAPPGPALATAANRVTDSIDQIQGHRATVNDGAAVIDLLVLYTKGMASKNGLTQVNNAVALTNQAMEDSLANVRLRLVAARRVNYRDGGNNGVALDDLSFFTHGFEQVPRLRNRFRADAVVLVRPFRAQSQGGCGIAWVNGADDSPMDSNLAFAVASSGSSGGYYCSQYTVAHELGHVLGAAHDRLHSSGPGRFPYSYGYGKAGRYGDIMSYFDPETGLYANPAIQACDGEACGIPAGQPGAADVVQTFNNTGTTVSGFLPSLGR